MQTLEFVQMSSRKPIDGYAKVYFSLFALLIVQTFKGSQIAALAVFSLLGIYADARSYLKVLSIPAFFVTAGVAVVLLVVEGEPAIRLWVLEISDEALRVAADTLLRCFASISIIAFTILTTSAAEFVQALSKLGLPRFACELLFLGYRAIQVIFDEISRLETAASLRMGHSGFRKTLETSSLLAFATFVSALRRAEIMEEAMAARCYSGEYPDLRTPSRGVMLALTLAALIAAAGWLM
ncbi:MAG: cobalt ECF transporter T component CbiQ [Archaeoglobaceae archaeon]